MPENGHLALMGFGQPEPEPSLEKKPSPVNASRKTASSPFPINPYLTPIQYSPADIFRLASSISSVRYPERVPQKKNNRLTMTKTITSYGTGMKSWPPKDLLPA